MPLPVRWSLSISLHRAMWRHNLAAEHYLPDKPQKNNLTWPLTQQESKLIYKPRFTSALLEKHYILFSFVHVFRQWWKCPLAHTLIWCPKCSRTHSLRKNVFPTGTARDMLLILWLTQRLLQKIRQLGVPVRNVGVFVFERVDNVAQRW